LRRLLARLLVSFLRLVTRIFFRHVEVVGQEHVPREGPVVLVGNHPNSLLDPVMIATTCGRLIRMAAKEPLFRGPLLPILWVLGAVPVRRRQDQIEGEKEDGPIDAGAMPQRVDNDAAFAALTGVLTDGDAFAIFPEGISHTRPELAPLKSGAARIVLGAADDGVPVTLVPCGLSYRRRDRMRSRVLVHYGRPIDLEPFRAQWTTDPQAAAKALTSTINLALRSQTVNAADFETLRVLTGVRALYRPPGRTFSLAEEAELMRRFVDHWQRKGDEPALRTFYDDVKLYQSELRALSITDTELSGSLSFLGKAERVLSHVFFLAVLVPIAVPGIILHAPVLAAAVMASRTLTDRGDVRATIQMIVVTASVLLTYLVAAAVVWWRQPTLEDGAFAAALTLGGLLFSGAAALRVLDGEGQLRRGLLTLIALTHLDRELESLRARRDSLRTRLLELVRTFIDAGLDRVVPEGEHGDADPWLDDEDHDVVA